MEEPVSTKPYMIRALYEWCVDNGLTPHLMVAVDGNTRVPMGYVKNGEIVLNINYSATKDLQLENEAISFSARFNGVPSNIYIPMAAVRGIFARENGQGMFSNPKTRRRLKTLVSPGRCKSLRMETPLYHPPKAGPA